MHTISFLPRHHLLITVLVILFNPSHLLCILGVEWLGLHLVRDVMGVLGDVHLKAIEIHLGG